MEPIKHISAVLIATAIILGGQIQVQAAWSDEGMHPMMAPGAPQVRVEPQHRNQPAQPPENHAVPVVNHAKAVSHDQPARQAAPTVNHAQAVRHEQPVRRDTQPDYFRRDAQYYGHIEVPFPYADVSDVDSTFTVPDGFETVMVNGETFYYNQGIFYQQVGEQLTAIPAVLGAVVDSIPQDYQIVMVDGDHYLVTGGVYYQRVDQGFEVVQPPASDLE